MRFFAIVRRALADELAAVVPGLREVRAEGRDLAELHARLREAVLRAYDERAAAMESVITFPPTVALRAGLELGDDFVGLVAVDVDS